MKLNKEKHTDILDDIARYVKEYILYFDEIIGDWNDYGDCIGLSSVYDCGLIDTIYDTIYSRIQSYFDDIGIAVDSDDDTINLVYERVSNLYVDELKRG